MRKQTLFAIAVLVQLGAHGQTREFSERGIFPTGSYTVSDIETINNVNGNLFVSIPIVQMPPGRSAYAGPVRLNYNSALLDVQLQTSSNQQGFRKLLELSEEGGWSYGFDYGLRVVTRETLNASPNCSVAEDVNTFKYLLLTPDGGKKELTLMSQAQTDTTDGYYRVGPSGSYFNCPGYSQVSGTTLVFYTTDGSFLRLELPFSGGTPMVNQTWKLYLSDGGTVEGKSDYTTKVTDPNGWSVAYTRIFNAMDAMTSFTIREDQPPFRTISGTTPSRAGTSSLDTFSWRGFGADLSTQVTWGSVDAGSYAYTCESAGTQCTLNGYRPVVTSVKIAKAEDTGPDLTYDFEYRDTAHCVATQCYGQLGMMKLPSGNAADRLVVNYEYALDGLALTPEYLDNPVKKKAVSYLEHFEGTAPGTVPQTETTFITVSGSSTTFKNAAGGDTVHYFFDPRMMSEARRGLVYRTINPDGSEVERLWWRNRTYNTSSTDPANPYVKLEVSTLPNGSGGASRSSARQSTIDKNGNSRIGSEHDWVNYTSVPRTGDKLTGAVPGSLLRRVTNTYHNVAADADEGLSDAADSTAAYWNVSAPRNLRAVKRSETANGSLATQAVVEIDYQNYLVASNKTQERRWDSQKSASNAAPLTAANSVITGYSYNCFGLVETVTDPNGYQAKTGYDANCLFPEWHKQAFGRSEERYTLFTHDNSTGLLTQTVDNNNAITTLFDYDRLGRRTLTHEASNSQQKQRKTVVDYDDTSRKVITKRDRFNRSFPIHHNIGSNQRKFIRVPHPIRTPEFQVSVILQTHSLMLIAVVRPHEQGIGMWRKAIYFMGCYDPLPRTHGQLLDKQFDCFIVAPPRSHNRLGFGLLFRRNLPFGVEFVCVLPSFAAQRIGKIAIIIIWSAIPWIVQVVGIRAPHTVHDQSVLEVLQVTSLVVVKPLYPFLSRRAHDTKRTTALR
ncbi:MAG: hypothetical protein ACKV2U_07865 [Bryobacteraceae bacterium]